MMRNMMLSQRLLSRQLRDVRPSSCVTLFHAPKRSILTVIGTSRGQPVSEQAFGSRFSSQYTKLQSVFRGMHTSSVALSTVEDPFVSDDNNLTSVRPKLRVADILKGMESKSFTVPIEATIGDAISHLVKEKMSSALVVNGDGSVAGIFTARDILKHLRDHSINASSRISEDHEWTTSIMEVMTSREKLVYCSPSDTVRRCREIMFQCKIRNMPVIEGNEIKGIITMKILADSAFNLTEIGGKKGFIHNVTGRRGLPENVKVVPKPLSEKGQSAASKLDLEVGAFALPHPFKLSNGVAMNHRNYGADELSTDLSQSEDAFFAIRLNDPLSTGFNSSSNNNSSDGNLSAGGPPSQVYICVADGVGSWRQFGVDPRNFSHKLAENAKNVIEADFSHRALLGHSPFDRDLDPIHPLDAILDAWNVVTADGVCGSSTICIATLDKKLNQLSYSNIGDGGLMVVRKIESNTAGYMRERNLPKHLQTTDLKIAYLSQQQLRSFNLPYQLGFSDLPNTPNNFESPTDADTASIPVMPGDIIVLATDGLFDNIDLNDIVQEISAWEKEWFSSKGKDLRGINQDSNKAVQELAVRLVTAARKLSLDQSRDSPFAILAKENDIMWGGGMPDDTTVIVARVVSN